MSVYRPKKSPYWHYDFIIKGVRLHGSTGTADKGQAKVIEAQKRTEAAKGLHLKQRPTMTLNEASGRYFEEVGQHAASASDIDYQLENLIAGLGKDSLLSEITESEIAEYVARRRSQVSNASANRETQLLRRVFKRAARVYRGDVGDMPDWGLLILPEPAERVRELSEAEETRLFEHLREDFHSLVRFCLLSGVRLMNAARLTWAAVDFNAMTITMKTKSRKPGGEVHQIPMTQAMMVLLANEKGHHPLFCFTYECKKSRGTRRKGERYPFSKNGWRKAWADALKAAGITDFKFHDLRHSAATRTLRAGGNLKTVQRQLGHAHIATTARYAHVELDDVRQAMKRAHSRNTPEPETGNADKMLKNKKK